MPAQSISMALMTPALLYARLPAPIPVLRTVNCSGSVSDVRSAATAAAPVGVTNSPLSGTI